MSKIVDFLGKRFSFLGKRFPVIWFMISSQSALSIIVKLFLSPSSFEYFLKIILAKEWNVPPATFSHLLSSTRVARDNISAAAFLVNVKRRIFSGFTPSSISLATR